MSVKLKFWCAIGIAAGFLSSGSVPAQAGVISAGFDGSFGLQADGSLWAWGYNGNQTLLVADYTVDDLSLMQEANQLGLNLPRCLSKALFAAATVRKGHYITTGYSTNTPTRVGSGANWVGIYAAPGISYEYEYDLTSYLPANAHHAFGLQKDGSLWAWGYDGDLCEVYTTNEPATLYVGRGALGLGNRIVAETFIYTNHTYKLTVAKNLTSTVTTNIVTNIYSASVGTPTRIGTDSDWLDVAPGSEHTLALKQNGSLWSWGYDGKGTCTIAINSATNRTINYAKGALGLGLDLLVTTWAETNGIGSTSEYVCNDYIQPVTAPTQIGTATDWVTAAAGCDHSLAVKSDGSLWAWGQNAWTKEVYAIDTNGEYDLIWTNFYGVLGLGASTLLATNTPTRVGADSDWAKVAAGAACSFAIKTDGSLWAWGDNGYVWWPGLVYSVYKDIAYTDNYAFAYGRLGLGTNVMRTDVPTRVGTDSNWTAIAVSMRNQTIVNQVSYMCQITDVNPQCLALKADGSLWAWGYSWLDYDLDLYTVTAHVQAVPIRIGTDNDWVAISVGVWHCLALKADGSLWAWGANNYGQSGNANGASLVPVQVGSSFTWGYAPTIPANDAGGADYDGDGQTDFALYDAASAKFSVRLSTRLYDLLTYNFTIGGPGYRLVTADFDGDGLADPAAYQACTGQWQIALSRYNYDIATFSGLIDVAGCLPSAADYDGDGLADPTVYKDGTAEWRLRMSKNAYATILKTMGGEGSMAASADYNGDGTAEMATYQPSTGTWKVMFGASVVTLVSFGGQAYVPAVADYDGDGCADPAIYEPGTGRLRIKLSAYSSWEYDSAAYGVFLGSGRCIPVPADYDGDGTDDPAIYNYVTGKWTIMLSAYGWYRWTSPW